MLHCYSSYTEYLGSFDTNYIICRDVEIFHKEKKFKEQKFVKANRECFKMLKNVLFFNMKPSKLVNYLADTC